MLHDMYNQKGFTGKWQNVHTFILQNEGEKKAISTHTHTHTFFTANLVSATCTIKTGQDKKVKYVCFHLSAPSGQSQGLWRRNFNK